MAPTSTLVYPAIELGHEYSLSTHAVGHTIKSIWFTIQRHGIKTSSTLVKIIVFYKCLRRGRYMKQTTNHQLDDSARLQNGRNQGKRKQNETEKAELRKVRKRKIIDKRERVIGNNAKIKCNDDMYTARQAWSQTEAWPSQIPLLTSHKVSSHNISRDCSHLWNDNKSVDLQYVRESRQEVKKGIFS